MHFGSLGLPEHHHEPSENTAESGDDGDQLSDELRVIVLHFLTPQQEVDEETIGELVQERVHAKDESPRRARSANHFGYHVDTGVHANGLGEPTDGHREEDPVVRLVGQEVEHDGRDDEHDSPEGVGGFAVGASDDGVDEAGTNHAEDVHDEGQQGQLEGDGLTDVLLTDYQGVPGVEGQEGHDDVVGDTHSHVA